MMNKKASHVGVILSFLVFITFIAFLYSVTEPAISVKQDKLDFLKYIKIELMKNFTGDLASVLIEIPSGSNCMKFPSNAFPGVEDWNVVAKDKDGNLIDSYKDSNGDVYVYENPEDYLNLYFSKEFENGQSEEESCTILKNYEIKLFRTEEWFFNSSVKKLADKMEDDYEGVKEQFGVAFDDNFDFAFKDGEGKEMVNTGEREVSSDIYSEEIPVQYVDSEANIKPGFLIVRVW